MEEIQKYQKIIFEDIKHIDENGHEYWLARELMQALKYLEWRKFKNAINKAMETCNKSNNNVTDHFGGADKMINLAKGDKRKITDYKLSRYACYLIVQNGDPRKEEIALGQTYFAVQTRKAEIIENYYKDYNSKSEDEKRILKRNEIRTGNYELNKTAKNAGYKGLYNGETADDIAKRKGLRYREEILDNMCSDELIANEFRISLTNQKLKQENTEDEKNASDIHFKMGELIRKTIKEAGTTLPEDFETPNKSIKQLKKEELKTIKGGSTNFLYNLLHI